MCVRITVKAVHLELMSDVTTDAFITTLRRFIARRGKPSLIQSDHGSNFVSAKKELEQLATFLQEQQSQSQISILCFPKNPVEIHSGKVASLWRYLGSCSQ